MQVLGHDNYPSQTQLNLQTHSTPKKTLVSQLNRLQNPQHFFSEKKKPIHHIKPKSQLNQHFHLQDFKENHPKPNRYHDYDLANAGYEDFKQNHPFTSVMNVNPQPKMVEPPRPTYKHHECEVSKQQIAVEVPRRAKQETKKYIEKIIENKLNHMVENKKKSASFKVHPGNKQGQNRPEKRKQSYHVNESKRQEMGHCQSVQQEDAKKQALINKQKNSISFIIRKKINSNATVDNNKNAERQEKMSINERLKSFQKEEFIKSQNSKYSCQTSSFNGNNTSENSTLMKYSYKPMENQLKKLRERQGESGKEGGRTHGMKGMKCLKVRVNKVLKAQEQLFQEKCFPKEKDEVKVEEMRERQSKQTKQIKQVKQSKQAKQTQKVNQWMVQKSKNDNSEQIPDQKTLKKQVAVMHPMQFGQRLVTIEQILQNQTRRQMPKPEPQSSYHQQQDSIIQSNLVDSQKSHTTNYNIYNSIQPVPFIKPKPTSSLTKPQQKWKSSVTKPLTQNEPTNRKRISSIRAIKNYYKKLQTQTQHQPEKQSFVSHQKQSKQQIKIKKKDKQSAGCLTHKIKWGTSSKKKLNSDRIPPDPFNYVYEPSIDSNKDKDKDHVKEQENSIHQPRTPAKHRILVRAPIQVKLFNSPKAKTPNTKAQFLEEQFLKAKYQRTPKQPDKNLQKIFAQTINSKQFIDCDPIPFHTGSKSLIMFEDPGISMIINNNNSIHSPHHVEGQLYQEDEHIAINDVSPVSMGKRRAYDMIEEKYQEEQNPLESLQELYFELKSRKELPKDKDKEMRIESLQELWEG